MNLFYQPSISQGITYLDPDESRHAVTVLRMGANDALQLTDGLGFFYNAKIADAHPKKCTFEILQKVETPRRKFHIHLAIAPTKNSDRMEWLMEKVTEIGVEEISFILCQNSERKVVNIERMTKVAVSAMKQSQQAWLPILHDIMPYKTVLDTAADQKFIAFVDATNPLHLQAAAIPEKKYLVLIGPEGDFSSEELKLAQQKDFRSVSLGINRLRTETAGFAAVHLLGLVNAV